MEHYSEMCSIKHKLIDEVSNVLNGDICNIDTHELGEVIDMIKDIAEYERNSHESEYYKSITNAMYSYENSSNRMSYIPDESIRNMMPDYKSKERYDRYMDSANNRIYNKDYDDKYGKSYNQWVDAKRHYTDTHSESYKNKMDEKATEHMNTMIDSIKNIWREADPTLKQTIKNNMTNLLNEMV